MTLKLTLTLGLTLLALPAFAGGTGKPATSSYDRVLRDCDQAGVAQNQDPDLVNGCGISQQGSGALWGSANGTDLSSVYDPNTGAKEFSVTSPAGAQTGTAGGS